MTSTGAILRSRPAWLLSYRTATMLSRSLNGWSVDESAKGLVADTAVALVA
jgi:hypothetical protein